MTKSSQGRTPISIGEPDWINAESLVRGRTAVHVTGKAIIQPTTTVANARLGGVRSTQVTEIEPLVRVVILCVCL